MTTDEFLSLPDHDKFERWLIDGELRERPMSLRHRNHSEAMARISHFLLAWALRQSGNAPRVFAGDGFFRLRRNPDSNVGIDVALATAQQIAASPENARFVEGAPLLAVEILSPSDMIEDIQEKKDEYLKNGTEVVWIVDPFQQTVTLFRPEAEPVLFSRSQTLSGEPELPGFTVSVADLFG
jgi:Uma2 family endonuclease